MRRATFLIVIVLLISFGFCFAESIDVSNLKTEELFDLKNAIEQELISRDVYVSDPMYPGTYVVGVDVAEGEYLFSFDPSLDDGFTLIRIYESEDIVNDNGEPIDSCTVNTNFQGRLKLENGNVVKVYNYSCVLEKLDNPSWAP